MSTTPHLDRLRESVEQVKAGTPALQAEVAKVAAAIRVLGTATLPAVRHACANLAALREQIRQSLSLVDRPAAIAGARGGGPAGQRGGDEPASTGV